MQEGKFRADLYYRLNVMSLTIAPLRMRSDDILLLLDYFLEKYGSAVRSEFLPPEVTKYLTAQTYPGNIRELRNLIERASLLADGEIDGVIGPRAPSCFDRGHPQVKYLFEDPQKAAAEWYERRKLFPIMHTLGVRKTLAEQHPWLPGALVKAFGSYAAMAA